MNLGNLSVEEVSQIINCERKIDELGRITLSRSQREFLCWKFRDIIICEIGEDEKSLILRKKEKLN